METAAQKCARLVSALEDLVAEETGCVALRDIDAILEVQGRAASVVEYLCANASAVPQGDRERIQAVLARRQHNAAWLAAEIRRNRDELQTLDLSQRRVAKVGPAYGTGYARPITARRFSAAG